MPAKSKAQREAMAIAEHHPEELYGRNKGMLKMTHSQLHDVAATSEKNMPQRVTDGNKEHHANRKSYLKRNGGGREHP